MDRLAASINRGLNDLSLARTEGANADGSGIATGPQTPVSSTPDLLRLARELTRQAKTLERELRQSRTDSPASPVTPTRRSARASAYRDQLIEKYRQHAPLSADLARDEAGLLLTGGDAGLDFPPLRLAADAPHDGVTAAVGRGRVADIDGNRYIDLRARANLVVGPLPETGHAFIELAREARAAFELPEWALNSGPAAARRLALRAARSTTGRTVIALIGDYDHTPGIGFEALDGAGCCQGTEAGVPASRADDYLRLAADAAVIENIEAAGERLAGVLIQPHALHQINDALGESALQSACARVGAALVLDGCDHGLRALAPLEPGPLADLLLVAIEPGDSLVLLGGETAWLNGLRHQALPDQATDYPAAQRALRTLAWYRASGRNELRELTAGHERLCTELAERLTAHEPHLQVAVLPTGLRPRLAVAALDETMLAAALALEGVLVTPGAPWCLHPEHDAETRRLLVERFGRAMDELGAHDWLAPSAAEPKQAKFKAVPLEDAANTRRERALRYWRSEYADGVPTQTLVANNSTPAGPEDWVSLFCWQDEQLGHRIDNAPLLRDRLRGTPAVTALAISLGVLCTSRDLVVGFIPEAGSAALPLRVPLVDDGDVQDYLELVGAIVADALENRDCDWERLRNELAARAAGSRALVDVAIALDATAATPTADTTSPGLTLVLHASEGALTCTAHYDRRRLDGATAGRCGTLVQSVLTALANLPADADLSALPRIPSQADCDAIEQETGAPGAVSRSTAAADVEQASETATDTTPAATNEAAPHANNQPAEQSQALCEGLGVEHAQELADALEADHTPPPATVGHTLTSSAAALLAGDVRDIAPLTELLWSSLSVNRTRQAILFNGKSVSYADLTAEAMEIAARLEATGAQPGEPVALLVQRNPSAIAAIIGTLLAGCGYLPLDPNYPQARLNHMLQHSGAERLIAEPGLIRELDCDDLTLIDPSQRGGAPSDWQRRSGPLGSLLYTSGSSGSPKGVAVTTKAIANFIQSVARTPGIGPDDRVLAIASLSFDIHMLEIIAPLCVGATVVLADDATHKEPRPLLDLVQRARVSVMQATPTFWGQCLDADPGDGLQHVRAFSGGEPMSPATRVRMCRSCAEVWNLYGPTETTVYSSGARQYLGDDDIHIGQPFDNTRIAIIDEDSGKPAPIGELGEIAIAGSGLASHYWEDPERTAAAFIELDSPLGAERYYRSGDRGFIDAEGRLFCRGRTDQQVKLRGHRIELLEVEHALADVEGIERAASALHSYSSHDTRLVAYYQLAAGAEPLSPAELRAQLALTLPAFMLPQTFMTLTDWPQLANGKLDRGSLPRPPLAAPSVARAEGGDGQAEGASRSTAELVNALWCELIGVETIEAQDNFFELGGHSVLAMQFVDTIRERLDKELPVRSLVLNDLAAVVAEIDALPAASGHSVGRLLSRVFGRLRPSRNG